MWPSPSRSARGKRPLLWQEASKKLAAAEEASSQLQKELKRTPPASIGDRALQKAVDEVTEAAAKARRRDGAAASRRTT